MCLFKCITRHLSENRLAVNVLTSPKNSWNLQKSTFILLFLHSEPYLVRKTYFESDLRFWDCLITSWLKTTSIPVAIERIYSYKFRSSYLENHKRFVVFSLNFWKVTWNLECSAKIMSLIGQVFLKLLTPKDVLT